MPIGRKPIRRKAITSREDAGVKIRSTKIKFDEGNQECLRCGKASHGWLLCEGCTPHLSERNVPTAQ